MDLVWHVRPSPACEVSDLQAEYWHRVMGRFKRSDAGKKINRKTLLLT